MAPDIELRPHQNEAVAATTAMLRARPRASVIAARGTGKTPIAARTTARIAPRGRVLVLPPTLDLLSRTIRSWRLAGRKGTAIAVCSARQALDHEPLGADIPLTTDPAELPLAREGQAEVFRAEHKEKPLAWPTHIATTGSTGTSSPPTSCPWTADGRSRTGASCAVPAAEADRAIWWLLGVARLATQEQQWPMLDTAVQGMCDGDGRWDRWDPRTTIRDWLRTLTGQAAALVASALRAQPPVPATTTNR